MNSRRYTIEANIAILATFAKTAAAYGSGASFVTRMTVSTHEEYYYVTLYGLQMVHDGLSASGFKNSMLVPTKL